MLSNINLNKLPDGLLDWQEKEIHNLIKQQSGEDEFYRLGARFLGENDLSIGSWTNTGVPSNNQPNSFFLSLKKEVHKFFCTDCTEYNTQRNQLGSTLENMVKVVSSAIAGSLGIAEGVIIGTITCIIIVIIKLGKNAWCNSINID
ncbi:TPA: hypothetical protein ACU21L_001858 [Mannheimia haemolytica]|uniref:Uncharacterized protein n=1 Tax=Mannheimia indoligenes TaxID=3103145 RepID=A0ABU7ZG27_9PAST